MSEYWGIPLLPFFSCAPAEKVPRFVFDFLAPSVRHFDGVAEKAPYGLRKLESSLLRKYGADEVVVAHPDHVSKFVDDKTSIIRRRSWCWVGPGAGRWRSATGTPRRWEWTMWSLASATMLLETSTTTSSRITAQSSFTFLGVRSWKIFQIFRRRRLTGL